MKYALIANPHARNGRGRKGFEQVRAEFARRGLKHDLALCQGMDHARELSREANRAGYDVVVGVGGDGTINRVLNGFFDSDGKRISQARMGVVHIGTSPDFCRSYDVPTQVVAAVAALAKGISRPVSVGRVLYERSDRSKVENFQSSSPEVAYFGCCANIGLGASLARKANGGIRKYAGDFLGTFLSLLQILTTFRPRTFQLDLDGRSQLAHGVYNISIGKTFRIASGIKVRHELSELDRRFYVLTVQNLSWINIAPVLFALYSGRSIKNRRCLSLDHARCVTLASHGAAAEVEFDGDPAGLAPCRIETACDSLDLITESCA